jgi:hypothetical protein
MCDLGAEAPEIDAKAVVARRLLLTHEDAQPRPVWKRTSWRAALRGRRRQTRPPGKRTSRSSASPDRNIESNTSLRRSVPSRGSGPLVRTPASSATELSASPPRQGGPPAAASHALCNDACAGAVTSTTKPRAIFSTSLAHSPRSQIALPWSAPPDVAQATPRSEASRRPRNLTRARYRRQRHVVTCCRSPATRCRGRQRSITRPAGARPTCAGPTCRALPLASARAPRR